MVERQSTREEMVARSKRADRIRRQAENNLYSLDGITAQFLVNEETINKLVEDGAITARKKGGKYGESWYEVADKTAVREAARCFWKILPGGVSKGRFIHIVMSQTLCRTDYHHDGNRRMNRRPTLDELSRKVFSLEDWKMDW